MGPRLPFRPAASGQLDTAFSLPSRFAVESAFRRPGPMSLSPSPKRPLISRRPNDKRKIIEHYDFVSPYYRALWGEHIHHGYWIRGDESKDAAQVQMIEHLVEAANIQPHARILDVGCGYGGSSIYLARKYGVEATGITISPVQVEMAQKAADAAGVSASFLCMDAESMHFDQLFDVLWSVESVSH